MFLSQQLKGRTDLFHQPNSSCCYRQALGVQNDIQSGCLTSTKFHTVLVDRTISIADTVLLFYMILDDMTLSLLCTWYSLLWTDSFACDTYCRNRQSHLHMLFNVMGCLLCMLLSLLWIKCMLYPLVWIAPVLVKRLGLLHLFAKLEDVDSFLCTL